MRMLLLRVGAVLVHGSRFTVSVAGRLHRPRFRFRLCAEGGLRLSQDGATVRQHLTDRAKQQHYHQPCGERGTHRASISLE